MPSRWSIPLLGVRAEAVRLEQLHAVVSRWFDTGPGEHAAGTKPYALSPLAQTATPGGVAFEVGVMTEGAAGRLAECAQPGSVIRLGHQQVGLAEPRLLGGESWESLANWSGEQAWELEFLTPVTFRRGDRSSPLPVPASVLRGLLDSWNAWSGLPARELDRAAGQSVWVSDIAGSSEPMTLSGVRVSGFVGRVRFSCDDAAVAAVIHPLFRLAPYCGVGSGRAKGLGVTRMRPTWQGRHGRKRAG